MATIIISRPVISRPTYDTATSGPDYIRGDGSDDVIIGGLRSADGANYATMLTQLSEPDAVEREEALQLIADGTVTRELAGTEAQLYPLLFNAAFMANSFQGLVNLFGGNPLDYSYAPVTTVDQALFGFDPISNSLPAPFSNFANLPISTALFTGSLPRAYDEDSPPEFGGNDRIYGRGGNDIIVDLAGDNFVVTEEGNDRILLGNGNDRIYDQGGNNDIDILGGNNTVTTRDGNDNIKTGDGVDNINAFDGRNIIDAGGGNNIVRGGDDYDDIRVGTGDDFVDVRGGFLGDQDLNGDGIADTGFDKNFDGIIDPPDQQLFLDPLGQFFFANNFVLDEGGSDNIRSTASGSRQGDDLVFSDMLLQVTPDSTLTGVPIPFTDLNFSAVTPLSQVGDDTIDLGAGDNRIFDGGGNNTIRTLQGSDTVLTSWYHAGDDDIDTGPGNDSIIPGSGADSVRGGSGGDFIDLGDTNFTTQPDVEMDTLIYRGDFSDGSAAGDDISTNATIVDLDPDPGVDDFDFLFVDDISVFSGGTGGFGLAGDKFDLTGIILPAGTTLGGFALPVLTDSDGLPEGGPRVFDFGQIVQGVSSLYDLDAGVLSWLVGIDLNDNQTLDEGVDLLVAELDLASTFFSVPSVDNFEFAMIA